LDSQDMILAVNIILVIWESSVIDSKGKE